METTNISQAFTEDFKKFKSWEDIENSGIDFCNEIKTMTKGQVALLKLNHIKRILNSGQKMNFTEGTIYYPEVRFVTKTSTYYNTELKWGCMIKVGTIELSCGNLYDVLGGRTNFGPYFGLGSYTPWHSVGYTNTNFGFLGCATQEIAEHMSRYFAKEIFDAMYSDFVDYKWI